MPDTNLQLPRAPQRARGRVRYENLLDAVDTLMADRDAGAVTIQDTALQADVPLASVYHYFPSNTALLVGLARRYLRDVEALLDTPLDHRALRQWSDICRWHVETARRFFIERPVAMKLLLGTDCGSQVRDTDREANNRLGHAGLATFQRHFVLPESPDLAERCSLAVTISDSILSVSYSRHRTVTEAMAEEAFRARVAYLRLYFPEHAQKRPTATP
jgi:AcrR family transcriptional regulator